MVGPDNKKGPWYRRVSSKHKIILLVAIIIAQAVIIAVYSNKHCETKVVINESSCEHERSESIEDIEDRRLPHGKHARRRLPHFIIIGVKKCGTRALLNFLNIHPDIVTASSEVHFFDRDEEYSNGLEWYRKQMPFSYPDQITGEKSPSYYRYTEAPERIHMMNSSIKLILLVREPIERCMSNYLQHKGDQSEYMSFEAAILDKYGEVNPHSPHVYNSDYSLFIDNWLKWFPREQIRLVDGQLLIDEPYKVMQDLQNFLGIRNYINEDFFTFDKDKGFYCYYNYSNNLRCLGESKGRPHPAINPVTKAKLAQFFAPRNAMFFEKVNQSFGWNYD